MLAEAQVIADTFSGRWDGGIGVDEKQRGAGFGRRGRRWARMSLWSFRFILWYICIMFVQITQQLLYRRRLLFLVDIAEKGEFQLAT